MTPLEFKAWFDGFSDGIDKVPTQKQWARIKDRVAEIDGRAITETVFIDRYGSGYPYYHPYGPVWVSSNPYSNMLSYSSSSDAPVFSGFAAMNALGKSEISELS